MSVNMKVGQGFAVYFVTGTQNPQTRIGVFSSIRFYDWVNILFLPLLSENSCDIYAYMFSFFSFSASCALFEYVLESHPPQENTKASDIFTFEVAFPSGI